MKSLTELRFSSADEAVKVVCSGDHIHLSSIASVPHILIQALCRRADKKGFQDLHFHHFHTEGEAPYSSESYSEFSLIKVFLLGIILRRM